VFKKKNNIITGLDIGTGSIKILVVERSEEEFKFEVLAQINKPSTGVRGGVVIKPKELSEKISTLIDEAQNSSGREINSVFLNINGSHINIVSSHGVVAVSRADQEISREDINRVIENSRTISLPSNREIIDVFPKDFVVDGEKGVKEVLGMKGTRLEVDVLLLSVLLPYLQNSTKAVSGADLQPNGIQYSSIAAAEAVLSSQQKELGVAVVDIGAETTGLAVFEEERLIHAAVFPIGSINITKDIAIALRCDIDLAEKIKKEFGSCVKGEKGKSMKSKVRVSESLTFSKKLLAGVIEARVSDVFDQVDKELKKISRQRLLPAGIVLVGGGSKLSGIKELAKKELKLPCRIGKPKNFIGLEKDPALATVCGLVLGGDADIIKIRKGVSSSSGFANKLKGFFRPFLP